MFDDPLLVRAAGAFQLTERARELLPRLEDALANVRELTRPAQFDPLVATGAIRISAPDIVSYMLIPPLLTRLAAEAPGLDLEVVQWRPDWREHLERGEIDLTVGFPSGTESNI